MKWTAKTFQNKSTWKTTRDELVKKLLELFKDHRFPALEGENSQDNQILCKNIHFPLSETRHMISR